MNIEQLAYLALKVIIEKDDRRGDVKTILNDQGLNLSDLDIREVSRYIERHNFGKITWYPKGHPVIDANLNAIEFVQKKMYIPLDDKLNLIYKELSQRLGRRADLEHLLETIQIPFTREDLNELINELTKTGNVKISARSKDGLEIYLTQKGLDHLYAPIKQQSNPPNIIIENYNYSTVTKGDNSPINSPKEAPIPSPNPNSPTRKIQKMQLIIAIIAVIIGFLTFYFNFLK